MREKKMMLTIAAITMLGGCNLFEQSPPPAHPVVATEEKRVPLDLVPATQPISSTPTMGETSEKSGTVAPGGVAVAGTEAYYLVVGSYTVAAAGKPPENATAAAKYLSDHGIPASVMMPTGTSKFATVVVSEGFASAKDGDALHKKVIEAGKKYPGTKNAFADSYFKKIKK